MRRLFTRRPSLWILAVIWLGLWVCSLVGAIVLPAIPATHGPRAVTFRYLDRDPTRNTWSIRQHEHLGWTSLMWTPDVPHTLEGLTAPTFLQGVVDRRARRDGDSTPEGRPRDSHLPEEEIALQSIADWLGSRGSTIVEVSSGWPFRCVRGDILFRYRWVAPADRFEIVRSRTIRVPPGPYWRLHDCLRSGVVPYGPIPAGIAANAGIAMAGWGLSFLVLRTIGRIRMALRRKRGRCVACGYSLTGLGESPCPECGSMHR
jgi:hypothetical protein